MTRKVIVGVVVALAAAGTWAAAQTANRPASPDGAAQVQVLGTWTKGDRPEFTLGRETYTGGKWIEITYGRPL
ncbi:MAG TPA: hypothetical protein VKI43_11835, partial [Vicinamibacterales bacterium]|nr:hypothetical protein [Vicinamibacterales bacterium]